ncbi:MAG: phosphoenolpyruvate--protein phosphotransferase [Dichotomicrobium sp.]
MTEPDRERTFRGLGVSGGVVIGPLFRLRNVAAASRAFTTVEEETRVFRDAVAKASTQLEALIAAEDQLAGEILEFQLALLDDEDMLAPVYRAIAGGTPCDAAWTATLDKEIAEYRKGGDDTLSARADDLADLRDRVLRAIHGAALADTPIPDGAVVLADDLTPSSFLDLDWDRIGGAATTGGSPVSHVSILARARGVNFLVGLKAGPEELGDGETVILDAAQGMLTVAPGRDTLDDARQRIDAAAQERKTMDALLPRPATTADGEPVKILVNIDDPGRLDSIAPAHCDGVGLTRTEFLFTDDRLPDEEAQYRFYRRLMEWAEGRPVTIRTLDAGGDKPITGLTREGEANPFMGLRGIRLSLANPETFRIQLRALARAAAAGPLNVMVPMVTVPGELDRARELMRAEVADLTAAGTPCALPRMGIMVEVPAAALNAASFDADFYSVGSNDLVQYVTACGRDSGDLAALADPLNPAVLELIRRTVEAAKARGADVSLCGDMASTPRHIAPLLDTGLRALSCAPAQIGPVKLAVSRYAKSRE